MTGVNINGNVFDGRSSAQMIIYDPARGLTTQVRYYWIGHRNTNALTIPGTNGAIFLGPNWFGDTAAGRARTLIHEAIHLIGDKRDALFDPGKQGDSDAGSDNLTRILADKCKLPKKKK